MSFVFISNPWEDGEKNPTSKHHVARELLRRGHRLLWINATGMRVPVATSRDDWRRIWQKLLVAGRRQTTRQLDYPTTRTVSERKGTIRVIAPLVIPVPGSKLARKVNAGIYMRAVRRWMKETGAEDPVLINFLPLVPEVMAQWPWKKVYYCVDRWDAFDRYDSNTPRIGAFS